MTSRSGWRRVTRGSPCAICERPDWCLVAQDGSAAICPRVESARRIGEAGWLHRLQEEPWEPRRRRVRVVRTAVHATPRADLARLASGYRESVDPVRVQQFAADLGLSVTSLCQLGMGWSREHQAWSFPMTDPEGNVLGIRLRRPDGVKFAVTGGKEGLFIPSDNSMPTDDVLLVSEGPTDAAALLDLGFAAVVGRPSCTGGIKLLVTLVTVRKPALVVAVADGDEPGQRGADNLASVLVAFAPAVRVIVPPEGIKDARAWLRAGATRADVDEVIGRAADRRLVLRKTKKGG